MMAIHNGYVITEGGRILVQTGPSGRFGFELWEPPDGPWTEGPTCWESSDALASLGSWTPIADDDPRIPWRGYARAWADREIKRWREYVSKEAACA